MRHYEATNAQKEVQIGTDSSFFCARYASVSATWINVVIEVLPLVQPNFCEPRIIVVDYLARTAREGIRGRLTEYVPDVRASRNFQCPTTHPYLTNSVLLVC